MKRFQCIGTQCEDNCCCGAWGINVDKNTYQKYQELSDDYFKPLLDQHVKKKDPLLKGSDETYAMLHLNEKGCCVFLDNSGLCSIQKKLGAEYLSNVCMTYPRHTNVVNKRFEQSAAISCPEVARLVLLNPEGIDFEEILEPDDTRYIVKTVLNTSVPNTPEYFFWDIRVFCIELVQNRKLPLAERLIILGLFIKKLQEYIEDKQYDAITNIIMQFRNNISEGCYSNCLSNIPSQPGIKIKLIKELTDERAHMGLKNTRYLECANQMLEGLGFLNDSISDKHITNYQEAIECYFRPYIQDREYILENYLVNKMFSDLFPLYGKGSVFDIYSVLIIRYAMIKLHLIGMSRYHKGLNDALVVKLIQSFSHQIDHSPPYINHICELLKKNDMLNMPYMTILLKD